MLDGEQLNHLSEDEKDRYNQFEEWFDANPWLWTKQVLTEQVEEMKLRALASPTWDETLFLRGQLAATLSFLSLPESTYNEFAAHAAAKQLELGEQYELDFE
jgi:hypothetical protein